MWGLRISIHSKQTGDAADPGISCPVVSRQSGIPGRPRNTPSITQLWGLFPSAFFFPLSEGKGGRGARMRIFKCLFKHFATWSYWVRVLTCVCVCVCTCVCVCVCVLVSPSCPAVCNPIDCSLPGSSVHRILQARILEWVAIPFSRGSSQPSDTWTPTLQTDSSLSQQLAPNFPSFCLYVNSTIVWKNCCVGSVLYNNVKLVIYWDPNALLEAQGEQQIFAVFAWLKKISQSEICSL